MQAGSVPPGPWTRTRSCRPTKSPARARAVPVHPAWCSSGEEVADGSDLDEHDLADAAICLWGSAKSGRRRTLSMIAPWPLAGRPARRAASIQDHRTQRPTGACATARARGGRRWWHIQLPNVDFFSRLGWSTVGGTRPYAGRPHQQMHIALPDPDRGAGLVAELARGVNCTCRGRGHRTRPVTVVAARSSTVDRSAPDRSASSSRSSIR